MLAKLNIKKTIVYYIWQQVMTDNLSFLAGSVAFYIMLSVFPAVSALVSLYGLVTDVADLQIILSFTRDFAPPDVQTIIETELMTLIEQPSPALTFAFVLSIFITLGSAARGMKAFLAALNLIHDVDKKRGWLRHNLVAYLFTVCGIVMLGLSIAALVLVPVVLELLPISDILVIKIKILRWVLISIVFVTMIGLLLHFGPNKSFSRRYPIVIGALCTSVLWIALSFALTAFMAAFPYFNALYGSFSAVVVLMLWFFLSVYAVLIGAAVHAGFVSHWHAKRDHAEKGFEKNE